MPPPLFPTLTVFANHIYRLFRWAGAYAPILMLACAILLLGTLSRALLVGWQLDRVRETDVWPSIFLHGLRVDMIMVGLVATPLVLLLPLLGHRFSWTFWKRLTVIWAVFAFSLFLFMELATPTFIAEYDTRPNRLFIEYLSYPKEILSMLWEGYLPTLIVGFSACLAVSLIFVWLLRPWLLESRSGSYGKAMLVWPLVVLAVFMSIRSSTGHRPANPAMFALTSDALVNSMIINSTWLSNTEFLSEKYPTLHTQTPIKDRARPLNLVIILEESLGATFVESLGGLPVTPRLEALKDRGWWFENLYAKLFHRQWF